MSYLRSLRLYVTREDLVINRVGESGGETGHGQLRVHAHTCHFLKVHCNVIVYVHMLAPCHLKYTKFAIYTVNNKMFSSVVKNGNGVKKNVTVCYTSESVYSFDMVKLTLIYILSLGK